MIRSGCAPSAEYRSAQGFLLAKLTGQEYTWKNAATDAALGAVGVGVVAGAVKLGRAARAARGVRYMGEGEAAAVRRTGTIPNTYADGTPKNIHYTTDVPTNSAQEAAERYLLSGKPTHICSFPLCNVADDVIPDGPVAPGATQRATSESIEGASRPRRLQPYESSCCDFL